MLGLDQGFIYRITAVTQGRQEQRASQSVETQAHMRTVLSEGSCSQGGQSPEPRPSSSELVRPHEQCPIR